MSNLIRFLFPPRKMYRPPKTISANYRRQDMTRTQALIMSAGLARDPLEAQRVYEEKRAEYGPRVWDYIELELRKPRGETFGERLLKLMYRICGEDEPRQKEYRRKQEATVHVDYRHGDF